MILYASKAAYLAATFIAEKNEILRYNSEFDLSAWNIKNQKRNKLNKLKKTNVEAFFYFYQALGTINML